MATPIVMCCAAGLMLSGLTGCATTAVVPISRSRDAEQDISPGVITPARDNAEDDSDDDVAVEPEPTPRLAPLPGNDDVSGPSEGLASIYSDRLRGRRTASGERYRPGLFTCAHRSLPFGTVLLVEDIRTGATVRCRVNDRGPFVDGRVVDLSREAARTLGILDRGLAGVRISIAPEPSSPLPDG